MLIDFLTDIKIALIATAYFYRFLFFIYLYNGDMEHQLQEKQGFN